MKAFAAVMFLCAAGIPPTFGDSATLKILVVGFRNENGALKYLLFNDSGGFPGSADAAVAGGVAEILDRRAQFVVSDLPYGRYALSLLHDEDGDDKMKTGLFGIPKEGYGFSNDAPLRLGPPSFEDAAIELAAPRVSQTITIRY